MPVNDRFIWAAEMLDIKPADMVLEIGCGTGILAQLLAAVVSTGQVIAIDKSKAMINSALKRNAAEIRKSRLKLLLTDFTATTFNGSSFDKITAFNVNSFLRMPTTELQLVRKYLKTSGSLYLFYQPPYELDKKFIEEAKNALSKNDFEIKDVVLQKFKPHSALCIISRPT